jgi:hypothetical protein
MSAAMLTARFGAVSSMAARFARSRRDRGADALPQLRRLPSSGRFAENPRIKIMPMARTWRLGPADRAGPAGATVCHAAGLTSIVVWATNDARRALMAVASFFHIAIVHGVGIWFGGQGNRVNEYVTNG